MSTVSNYVAFNYGEYDPFSADSQHVIVHVGPQTGGAAPILLDDTVNREIDPDLKPEEEAEETAQRVMADGKLDIQRMHDTEVHVQRFLGSSSSGGGGGDDYVTRGEVEQIVETKLQTSDTGGAAAAEQDAVSGMDPETAAQMEQQPQETQSSTPDEGGGKLKKATGILGQAASEGAVGAVGGAAGAALGSVLLPGVGTAAGAAIGKSITEDVAKEAAESVGSGVGGDVAKAIFGETVSMDGDSDVPDGDNAQLADLEGIVDKLLDEKVSDDALEQAQTDDSDSQGVGSSRRD